jgi:hypothetical protein
MNPQTPQINIADVIQLLGEKDVVILQLRKRVADLEAQIAAKVAQ